MPPKLKRVVVSAGVPPGVPPPNDGAEAVNIDRRLKLTADAGVSESIGGAICDGDLAASARSCVVADVSFVETNGAMQQLSNEQLSNTQLSTYLASLSELEQRVCSIAKDHLESSFDLSRSSGFIAWAGKK